MSTDRSIASAHMQPAELISYRHVQSIAKQVLEEILPFIQPGVSERELVDRCDTMQRSWGVQRYWYQSLPALVLIGSRTMLTISDTPYAASDRVIQSEDLVTIDLNPEIASCWGDCARSYFIESGVARMVPTGSLDFLAGYAAEKTLHEAFLAAAYPEMTFDECARFIDDEIERLGFVRLDEFSHSIACSLSEMRFVKRGSDDKLKDIRMFTLEPHIRHKNGNLGFKHEDIYYFIGDRLARL